MQVCPLTPHVGAEVAGGDLSAPITGEVAGELKRALLEWKVLFFRDQHDVDPVSQLAFAGLWGPPEPNPFFCPETPVTVPSTADTAEPS